MNIQKKNKEESFIVIEMACQGLEEWEKWGDAGGYKLSL